MKTNRYICTLLLCFLAFSLYAQNYLNQISVENVSIERQADVTAVAFELNLTNLRLHRNHLLQITPVISSADGLQQVELAPVYVIGRTRYIILNRPFTWEGKPQLSENALLSVVRRNRANQVIYYVDTTLFEEWKQQLTIRTYVVGCPGCDLDTEELALYLFRRPAPEHFEPTFLLALVAPAPTAPRRHVEDHSARINFQVGRHELLPNFGNNAAVLAEVDRVFREFREDDDLIITDLTISGFASPEGSQASNLALSQRRAETFARYIEQTYGFTRDQINVQWFGEDWDGLRHAVANSTLHNRYAIIRIIDTEPNFDARDALIIALDNGHTYNILLRDFYPPLRRIDYSIAFVLDVDVIDAARLVETNPYLLEHRQIWDVAYASPEDSDEFKRILTIAADTFPDNEKANLNVAVLELRRNNIEAATARLRPFTETSARAQNLMAVAYALRGETQRASTYFNRAIQSGCEEAHHNAIVFLLLEQVEQN